VKVKLRHDFIMSGSAGGCDVTVWVAPMTAQHAVNWLSLLRLLPAH